MIPCTPHLPHTSQTPCKSSTKENTYTVLHIVLLILAASLPLASIFLNIPLPLASALTISLILIVVIAALSLLSCGKIRLEKKQPYSIESTITLLREYNIDSWEPGHGSLRFANQITLTHNKSNTRLCLHKGHPFDCKQTHPRAAFLFSIIPSIEKEGNCARTHSCIAAISSFIWNQIKKSPIDKMTPSEYRILSWEPAKGLPPRASHLIFTVETTLEDLEKPSGENAELSELMMFSKLFASFEKNYLELFVLCFEYKINELHIQLLGDNIPKPVNIGEKSWELMKVFPLLKAISQLSDSQKETLKEIHIDNPKETPLKGLLLTL
ncbi:hypothetical protein [Chlamydiifrater phoenicopteri]|uniref:hypothetical protein n=1 Tax=Chlamydiifrater phoenicopteri TaxID=2681469 RepID=UPI001BCE4BC7|nr:hypothetical protein [Chlamydiifrater phoenicopteri]